VDRLFLDANVLFSAAYRQKTGLLALWRLKHTALCTSHYALEEARVNLSDEEQQARLRSLSIRLELFDAAVQRLPKELSLPEKDVPIMLAAIEAQATHLLTGDMRHFGKYFGKKVMGILIISPGDYLRTRAR
jgi:predicted nucleic acid-binding protein